MKILFLGDIVSQLGRQIVKKYIPILKQKHQIQIVIANGENSAHGRGITSNIYNELLDCNIDVITMGNHYLGQRESKSFYQEESDRMVRPYNISSQAWGVGTRVFSFNGVRIRVTNLLGKTFINELQPTNPFDALDEIIANSEPMIHIVDFHAEATAEKIAMGWYFQNRISAILGTHTHVQTADNRILPGGSGYISDVGMCGPYDGIIGAARDENIFRQRTGLPTKFEVQKDGAIQLSGVILDIDEKTFKCTSIERLYIIDEE